MKSTGVEEIAAAFVFLEKKYGYSIIEKRTENVFDNILIAYNKKEKENIRVTRERGYFNFEIEIQEEYFGVFALKKYFAPDEQINRFYKGENGLKLLASDAEKIIEMIDKKKYLFEKSKIISFFRDNPSCLSE